MDSSFTTRVYDLSTRTMTGDLVSPVTIIASTLETADSVFACGMHVTGMLQAGTLVHICRKFKLNIENRSEKAVDVCCSWCFSLINTSNLTSFLQLNENMPIYETTPRTRTTILDRIK